MIKEFRAFFTLFQQGKQLANSAAWKNHQIKANTIAGLIAAAIVIAGGFGYHIAIDEATLQDVGAGVVAIYSVVNTVLTVITSAKVGIKQQ